MEVEIIFNGHPKKVPEHIIQGLARAALPAIQEYYKTEAGQKAFKKWQAEQEMAQEAPQKPTSTVKKRQYDLER